MKFILIFIFLYKLLAKIDKLTKIDKMTKIDFFIILYFY
jgi:hypothetical protein